jgi:hypothetical protein
MQWTSERGTPPRLTRPFGHLPAGATITHGVITLKLKLALVAAALALSAGAQAADKRSSVSIFGNIVVPEEGENSGTVFISYGYLLTSALEIEGSIGQTYSAGFTSSILSGGLKYYFGAIGKAGAVVPYVKASAGRSTSTNAFSPDSTDYGGGVGVEFTMNESASTFIEGVFQSTKYDTIRVNGFNVGGNTSSQVLMQVGVKLRF